MWASTQVSLTGLFLVVMHGPKTRLTSHGEHALIRPWLWTLTFDVGSYNTGPKTANKNTDARIEIIQRR